MADNTTEGENQVERDAKLIKETVHLQQLLPEEIWERVLDNLKDPVDLINVGNASPAFKRMLAPRSVEYLFPAVWDILGVRLHKTEERERNPDRVPHSTNPKKGKRKWYSDILAARAVCRGWKKAIDEFYFYESLPAKYAQKGGQYALAGTLFDTRWASDPFRAKPVLLVKFLQHFKATHADGKCDSSPFLTKRFTVSYEVPNEAYPVNSWITQVLQTYGRHVLICEFTMDFCRVTRDTFALILQWLSFMPNLKSLTILCYGRVAEDSSLNMKVVSRRQRLPKLEKLEYLHFLMCSPPLVQYFRQTYQNVTFFVDE